MGNYTPNLFMIQPIYDPTRPFATPSQKGLQCCCPCSYKAFAQVLLSLSISIRTICLEL